MFSYRAAGSIHGLQVKEYWISLLFLGVVTRAACMLWAYINRLFIYALRPRLSWADFIAFVLGFFAPLAVWLASEEADEFDMSTVRDEFLVGIVSVVLLRFICAPYLIWRELIAYVSELHRELDGKVR